MEAKNTPDESVERLAELTSRYARYSRSAGGLSLVIGGSLALAAFVIGATAPLTPGLRLALATTPLLWLLSKELLRAFYYQRHGAVTERLSARQRRNHRWMVVYLSLVSIFVLARLLLTGADIWQSPGPAYVAIVIALPLVAARWFWSTDDFLVGVLLFCQAAVVLAGSHYPWYWIAFAALCAAIAIAAGVREHRDFQHLRRQFGPAANG